MQQTTVKLVDKVRDELRLRHYPIRTEQSYLAWIKRFIAFHQLANQGDTPILRLTPSSLSLARFRSWY